MDQVFEGTPSATIRLEGRRVIRSEVENDWGSRLQWKITRGREVVATPSARGELHYDFAETMPGQYEISLEIYKYDGFRNGSLGRFLRLGEPVTLNV